MHVLTYCQRLPKQRALSGRRAIERRETREGVRSTWLRAGGMASVWPQTALPRVSHCSRIPRAPAPKCASRSGGNDHPEPTFPQSLPQAVRKRRHQDTFQDPNNGRHGARGPSAAGALTPVNPPRQGYRTTRRAPPDPRDPSRIDSSEKKVTASEALWPALLCLRLGTAPRPRSG